MYIYSIYNYLIRIYILIKQYYNVLSSQFEPICVYTIDLNCINCNQLYYLMYS